MLLNLVWDRSSDSKTFERTFPKPASKASRKSEERNRVGFLARFEKLLSAYAELVFRDLGN